jgi:hypothetical protein
MGALVGMTAEIAPPRAAVDLERERRQKKTAEEEPRRERSRQLFLWQCRGIA